MLRRLQISILFIISLHAMNEHKTTVLANTKNAELSFNVCNEIFKGTVSY